MSLPMKIVVLRGDRYDVAEWEPGEPPWFGTRPPVVPQGSGKGAVVFALVASLLVVAATFLLIRAQQPKELGKPLVATVGDLSAVHAKVTDRGEEVRRLRRVSVGDVVETDEEGRARLRLDDGTSLVLDRATKLTLTDMGLGLDHGRLFVQGALGARAEIDVGGA
ncbi:MAG TPA: hypothetical protein VHB21_20190, partial [Minicystis sp.]|nr:hypothetical protein [Minicystis sp.]